MQEEPFCDFASTSPAVFDRAAGTTPGASIAHTVKPGRLAVHLADPHRIARRSAPTAVAIVMWPQLRVVVVVRTGRMRRRTQIRVRMVVRVHCY